MNRWFWAYAALFLALAALEVYGVWFRPARDDTISEFLGHLFRAGTIAGWWALMLLFGFLAAWMPAHVRRLALRKAGEGDTAAKDAKRALVDHARRPK